MKDSISNTKTPGSQSEELWLPEWNASYAANTGHHRAFDAFFLETTPLSPSYRVLDLGCGSGDFTRVIADLVPDGEVIGLDPQPSLLAEARACAGPNQSFVEAPVQHLAEAVPADPSICKTSKVPTRPPSRRVHARTRPAELISVRRAYLLVEKVTTPVRNN